MRQNLSGYKRTQLSNIMDQGDQGHTKDNHTCSTITTFLVLCPTKLDHVLCGRVGDINFTKDSIAVISQPKVIEYRESFAAGRKDELRTRCLPWDPKSSSASISGPNTSGLHLQPSREHMFSSWPLRSQKEPTFAAVMFEICAFRPDCRSGAVSDQNQR